MEFILASFQTDDGSVNNHPSPSLSFVHTSCVILPYLEDILTSGCPRTVQDAITTTILSSEFPKPTTKDKPATCSSTNALLRDATETMLDEIRHLCGFVWCVPQGSHVHSIRRQLYLTLARWQRVVYDHMEEITTMTMNSVECVIVRAWGSQSPTHEEFTYCSSRGKGFAHTVLQRLHTFEFFLPHVIVVWKGNRYTVTPNLNSQQEYPLAENEDITGYHGDEEYIAYCIAMLANVTLTMHPDVSFETITMVILALICSPHVSHATQFFEKYIGRRRIERFRSVPIHELSSFIAKIKTFENVIDVVVGEIAQWERVAASTIDMAQETTTFQPSIRDETELFQILHERGRRESLYGFTNYALGYFERASLLLQNDCKRQQQYQRYVVQQVKAILEEDSVSNKECVSPHTVATLFASAVHRSGTTVGCELSVLELTSMMKQHALPDPTRELVQTNISVLSLAKVVMGAHWDYVLIPKTIQNLHVLGTYYAMRVLYCGENRAMEDALRLLYCLQRHDLACEVRKACTWNASKFIQSWWKNIVSRTRTLRHITHLESYKRQCMVMDATIHSWHRFLAEFKDQMPKFVLQRLIARIHLGCKSRTQMTTQRSRFSALAQVLLQHVLCKVSVRIRFCRRVVPIVHGYKVRQQLRLLLHNTNSLQRVGRGYITRSLHLRFLRLRILNNVWKGYLVRSALFRFQHALLRTQRYSRGLTTRAQCGGKRRSMILQTRCGRLLKRVCEGYRVRLTVARTKQRCLEYFCNVVHRFGRGFVKRVELARQRGLDKIALFCSRLLRRVFQGYVARERMKLAYMNPKRKIRRISGFSSYMQQAKHFTSLMKRCGAGYRCRRGCGMYRAILTSNLLRTESPPLNPNPNAADCSPPPRSEITECLPIFMSFLVFPHQHHAFLYPPQQKEIHQPRRAHLLPALVQSEYPPHFTQRIEILRHAVREDINARAWRGYHNPTIPTASPVTLLTLSQVLLMHDEVTEAAAAARLALSVLCLEICESHRGGFTSQSVRMKSEMVARAYMSLAAALSHSERNVKDAELSWRCSVLLAVMVLGEEAAYSKFVLTQKP